MVNTLALQERWEQVRSGLKKRWDQLTDEDLRLHHENLDQLVGRIHHRTGEAREAIERFLEDLSESGGSALSAAVKSAGDYAKSASEQFREGYNRLSDQVGRQFDKSAEVIREKPAHSLATALAVGVLLGVAVGLALRSRT